MALVCFGSDNAHSEIHTEVYVMEQRLYSFRVLPRLC